MKDMTAADRQFYGSLKPSWGPDGTLVYASQVDAVAFNKSPSRMRENNGLVAVQKGAIVSEGRDVRFAKISNEVSDWFFQNSATYANLPSTLPNICKYSKA